MSRERYKFDLFLRLAKKYEAEARCCLEARAYYAGIVCVRAALETLLFARFLLGLMEWDEDELEEYNIIVDEEEGVIEARSPRRIPLQELISEAHRQGVLSATAQRAAERIRVWGNRIHCTKVVLAAGRRLPPVGYRNLKARLNDLERVCEALAKTI